MKKLLSVLSLMCAVMCMFASPAHALTVSCVNCSNSLLQALDRATNMEQLSTLISEYHESVTQTAQQIRMVQQNIEQYANMAAKHRATPGQPCKRTQRQSDPPCQPLRAISRRCAVILWGLDRCSTPCFPNRLFSENWPGPARHRSKPANAKYQQQWDKWSATVDQASQATFQLSGHQLDDLQKDAGRFQSYLDELLSTPDGQQKAIMAGNQLSALQVQEARQLRELMATQVQSDLASQMKTEKRKPDGPRGMAGHPENKQNR